MNQVILKILIALVAVYMIVCVLVFFLQEKLIFFPQKLNKEYKFDFEQQFEEIYLPTKDKTLLHGILFKSDNPTGLIFYLHGNAGSLSTWGEVAKTYTALNYDVFILDYRGFGKSEGSIIGQEQIFDDIQIVYEAIKKRYTENEIVVLGYSLGTGLAAKLASTNNPRLLVLQTPYYSLIDIMRRSYPILPTFILKYKFETNRYLQNCKMPIVIFHGDQDEVIYYGSSLKLKEEFSAKVTLIPLIGQGHNGMTDNTDYRREIQTVLKR